VRPACASVNRRTTRPVTAPRLCSSILTVAGLWPDAAPPGLPDRSIGRRPGKLIAWLRTGAISIAHGPNPWFICCSGKSNRPTARNEALTPSSPRPSSRPVLISQAIRPSSARSGRVYAKRVTKLPHRAATAGVNPPVGTRVNPLRAPAPRLHPLRRGRRVALRHPC
jgi:hypothetical protein